MITIIAVSIISLWIFLFCAYMDGKRIPKLIGELVSIPFCVAALIIGCCVKAVEKMDIN